MKLCRTLSQPAPALEGDDEVEAALRSLGATQPSKASAKRDEGEEMARMLGATPVDEIAPPPAKPAPRPVDATEARFDYHIARMLGEEQGAAPPDLKVNLDQYIGADGRPATMQASRPGELSQRMEKEFKMWTDIDSTQPAVGGAAGTGETPAAGDKDDRI
mmetsp:Transcript_84176/g.191924  ORF Transcript_84176/g.191924 Transcript_84176/m.191924 type:complete len:161 (-) Transcript_84176:93-575(-)